VAEVETHFEQGMRSLLARRGELNQVILNLVVNAAHAIADTNRGDVGVKGKITVSTRTDGNFAVMEISDTGTGIPEAIRSRIFDPFFTTKPVGKGTGQGLAIARSVIVDRHQGRIDVASEVGKGTTFIVRLPFESQTRSSMNMKRVRV
jgi:signal transduction histidine kinase